MVLILPQYSTIDGIVGNGRYNTNRESRGRDRPHLTYWWCWLYVRGFGWRIGRVLPGGELFEVTKMALLSTAHQGNFPLLHV